MSTERFLAVATASNEHAPILGHVLLTFIPLLCVRDKKRKARGRRRAESRSLKEPVRVCVWCALFFCLMRSGEEMKTMMTKGDGKRKTKGGIDTRMSAASYLPLTSARIWPSFATARHHLCQIWAWGKRRSRLFLVAFRELEKRRRAQQPTRADCSAAARSICRETAADGKEENGAVRNRWCVGVFAAPSLSFVYGLLPFVLVFKSARHRTALSGRKSPVACNQGRCVCAFPVRRLSAPTRSSPSDIDTDPGRTSFLGRKLPASRFGRQTRRGRNASRLDLIRHHRKKPKENKKAANQKETTTHTHHPPFSFAHAARAAIFTSNRSLFKRIFFSFSFMNYQRPLLCFVFFFWIILYIVYLYSFLNIWWPSGNVDCLCVGRGDAAKKKKRGRHAIPSPSPITVSMACRSRLKNHLKNAMSDRKSHAASNSLLLLSLSLSLYT